MRRTLIALAGAAALFTAGPAAAQGTIKIGLIMPYSGQFADAAAQMDNAIKLFVKQNGDTVAGKKLEFIRKDTGGIAPDVAKRLAQELIVRDNVDILAGFVLTPNALAAGTCPEQAKKFMVVMNAATSIITTKSQYMCAHLAHPPPDQRLARHLGLTRAVSQGLHHVSDFGPASTPKARSSSPSRKPAARSSGRSRWRSPIPTSRPTSSAPRT